MILHTKYAKRRLNESTAAWLGSLELFDTTVDTVTNPSILVAYHDAQAYPEYLVSFKHGSP